MTLHPVEAFTDNYIWVLDDERRALVVDPGDAGPVRQYLAARSLQLDTILITHHHRDHTGGVADLLDAFPGTRCIGPAGEPMPVPTQSVQGGEAIEALGLRFEVIDVPGHTAGHVAYWCEQRAVLGQPLLFCGDTLFSGGCGRLFEGTPAQMLASLDRLATLPGDTRVCAAHEYTLSNLRFARHVDPDNTALAAYEAQCEARRAAGQPTLPSTIEIERHINPFLRAREPALAASLRDHGRLTAGADAVAVFTALREWKNVYR
jgi:hydroxyacylglutathione hydrolase